MFGMGMGELIVILIVALVVLGPDRLPEAARTIGKGIRELRRHTRDLEETIEQDEQLGSTVRDLKSALRGDPFVPPLPPRPGPRRDIERTAAVGAAPSAPPPADPTTAPTADAAAPAGQAPAAARREDPERSDG